MRERKGNPVMKILRTQWFLLLLVILVISAVTGLINPRFFRLANIVDIFEQISTLGVVASGATILIISGNFDISVGAIIGLTASVMAMAIKANVPTWIVVPCGILLAALCDMFVGFSSIVFRAPSFITSLASIGIFNGIALALTMASLQTIFGKFAFIGSTRFLGVVPLMFLLGLVVYFVVHFVLKLTRLGRRVYAVGSNPQAAYLSGINVSATKLVFFVINGLLVGIAATMLLSRIGAAEATTGAGIELQAIGAVVIGGTPINGGKGGIFGTFLGVFLMGLISNSLNMLQASPYLQDFATGVLIILAVAVSAFSQKRRQAGI
ncbi:MAG: ABC transporter permease [Rectinemataceae bacterium]